MYMFPGGYVHDIISVVNLSTVKQGKRSSSHEPSRGPTCADLEAAVLATVEEIIISFNVELVLLREADGRDNVQLRCMPDVPVFPRIVIAGSDAHVGAQPWNHGLTLTRGGAMPISQGVLTHHLIDLSDSMVKDPLERNH